MNRIALLLMCLVVQHAASAAQPPTSRPAPLRASTFSVLAHSDERQFWIAQISQFPAMPGTPTTAVYYRLIGDDTRWQLLTRFPQSRLIDLASQGSTAGLLMEDGTWQLLYTDGNLVTAGPLPAPARMVALAGGRNTWWAVGEVLGGIKSVPPRARSASTTGPATRKSAQAVPALQPQSQPAEVRLVLFKLNGNDWDPVSELPGQLPEVSHLSLMLADDTPYLADLDREGALQVRHLDKNQWVTDLHLSNSEPIATFRLLDGQPPVRLWVDRPAGNDQVFTIGLKAKPVEIAPITRSAPGGRTMVLFAGKLRMIARTDDTLDEQDYSIETGAPEAPTQVPLPKPSPLLDLQTFQTIVVIAAFVAILFGWYRNQAQSGGKMPQPDVSRLAPLGRRFFAGLIDASPVILTVVFTSVRDANSGMSAQSQELVLWLAYWAAGLFYILYTTMMEALAGRTLGKILMGLYVAGLDGKPPTPGALITRNILRVFDVGAFFIPVVMVPVSPLRQRPGDVAAATLVVKEIGTDIPADEPPDKQSNTPGDGKQE